MRRFSVGRKDSKCRVDERNFSKVGDSGFDVDGGLAAGSLREFETAISTVAHGYDSLEKFYEDASSEASLERVQIPLLCIQHTRDYFEHSISFSRSVSYNQPYLMLLVPPSEALPLNETPETSDYPGLASEWSHGIALEWLAAVEVALLRGRHPLLDVMDLTVKPGGKEWSPVGSQIPSMKSREKLSTTYQEVHDADQMEDSDVIDVTGHISDLPELVGSDTQEASSYSPSEAVEPKAPSSSIVAHSGQSLIAGSEDTVRRAREDSVDKHSSKQEEGTAEEGNPSSDAEEDAEAERGQVHLAAENVMKVLDVTMPGTLAPEQKQQVLEAVGRGESLVGALQEAVPEDVRGTMAGAVSAAVQAKGISFKTAGIKKPMQPPKLPDQLTEALKAKDAGANGSPPDPSERKGGNDEQKPPDPSETKGGTDGQKAETHSENAVGKANPSGDGKAKTEHEQEAKHGTPEDHSSGDGTVGDEVKKSTSVTHGEQQTSAGTDASHSDNPTKGDSVPPGREPQGSVKGDSAEASGQESGKKTEKEPETTGKGDKDHSSEQGTESKPESEPTDQRQPNDQNSGDSESKAQTEIPSTPESPHGQAPGGRQVTSVPSVGEALQALTGFDDATQMAVTNVFGVVENVLDQLENDNPSTNGGKEGADNSGAPENVKTHETSGSDSEGGPGPHPVDLAEKEKKGRSGDQVVVNRQHTQNGDIKHHPERPLSSVDKNGSPTPSSAASHDETNSLARPSDESERRLAALAAEVDQEAEQKLTDVEDTNPDTKEDGNMVRDVVLNALKFEVVRRLGASGIEALGIDFEEEASKVAQAVSEAAKQAQSGVLDALSDRNGGGGAAEGAGKLGVLNGNIIIRSLSTALGSTGTLGNLVPLGVLVGAVLAALGAVFLIVSEDEEKKEQARDVSTSSEELPKDSASSEGSDEGAGLDNSSAHSDTENSGVEESSQKETGANRGSLMGAMTAAMGATAAVASQKSANTAVHTDSSAANARETDGNKEQATHGSGGENGLPKFVPDIAEKAISMVAPVVPKKEDGEVDQDRIVAMLAEIGQKGGILRLVGKAALLWGGLRGAMSLADRLLGFLRIRERPLPQRLLGFLGMAVLLWTPVLVPLLPTLLQQWATKSPSGVADAAAGVGLYGAVFILITIWGKRVRDYDRPLVAYGLELLSRAKVGFVGVGMVAGVNLVAAYYGINWALGYVSIRWASLLVQNPSFPGLAPVALLTLWNVVSLLGQSVSMALIVALVEELLFRAWLQEEIAVDVGQHVGILLSAVAFAIVHWSPQSMAGLWFLSVALAGARSRMEGDLSLPIGIHAGIVAAYSFASLGGLAYFSPNAPTWLTGAYAGNPLAGAIGTAMAASLALLLYPRTQELPPEKDDDYYHLEDDS
ncbi:hypothetical protein R1sor_022630 [Riccia sorocarpa]|uniref:CAAX amino terminal protease n=1 Tax=Riccia sorocarpa TaxID=122646 RepID=A0ABD3GPM4_9MARC